MTTIPQPSPHVPKPHFDLNLHVYRLLQKEPFYAHISRHIDKQATTTIPTAGVRVNKETKQFEMVYNSDFFLTLSDDEKGAVLIHEFDHIVYGHVTGRLPAEGMTKLWNIAADLAINSHIPHIPKMACIPGKGAYAQLPPGKAAEFYFEELKKMKEESVDQGGEEGGEEGGEGDPLDDHSGWSDQVGDMDNTTNEIARERLKDIVRKAAEECAKSSSWGSVSSEMRKTIMDSLTTTVDWRKMLRYFVKASQRCDKSSTIKKLNKRYPRIHSGKKTNRVANIAISIDQSGSVDDGMLAMFFSELNSLSAIATFTVIPFDTTVDDKLVYVWKKGKKQVWNRVMCGGTDFDAPTKWVNKDPKFDGHIVLTDMCASKPVPSRCPRMWMTNKANASSPYFKTSEVVVAVGK